MVIIPPDMRRFITNLVFCLNMVGHLICLTGQNFKNILHDFSPEFQYIANFDSGWNIRCATVALVNTMLKILLFENRTQASEKVEKTAVILMLPVS